MLYSLHDNENSLPANEHNCLQLDSQELPFINSLQQLLVWMMANFSPTCLYFMFLQLIMYRTGDVSWDN